MGIWTACTLRYYYITCSLITYRRLNYWLSDSYTAVKSTLSLWRTSVMHGKMRNVYTFSIGMFEWKNLPWRSACMQERNSELSHFPIDRRDVSIYTAFFWLWMLLCGGVHIKPFMKFMVPKICDNSHHLSHYQLGKKDWSVVSDIKSEHSTKKGIL